jgi:hypothetical protein
MYMAIAYGHSMFELMQKFFVFADKADWLGLDDKTDSGNSAKAGVDKDEDLSPQTSLQGSVLTFYSILAL